MDKRISNTTTFSMCGLLRQHERALYLCEAYFGIAYRVELEKVVKEKTFMYNDCKVSFVLANINIKKCKSSPKTFCFVPSELIFYVYNEEKGICVTEKVEFVDGLTKKTMNEPLTLSEIKKHHILSLFGQNEGEENV